jgi:hypothetical protein
MPMENIGSQEERGGGFRIKPGSRKAVQLGCVCPVMDNSYGGGYMGVDDVFVVRKDCPLHGDTGREQTIERHKLGVR